MVSALEKRLLRVQDYIHENPAGDLSLDRLAEVAALSRFHFQRTYRLLMGETAAQTVRRIRMHRASVAVLHSQMPLRQIAREVGYPNLSSFTRVFTESFGKPPMAYRKDGVPLPFPHNRKPDTKDHTIMPDVAIRTLPARNLIAVPHKGDYQLIGRDFERLFTTLAARGQMGKAGAMIGVYLDDPESTPTAELRSFAAVEFPEDTAPKAPLEHLTLAAGRYAVLLFKGPYTGLPAGYAQLFREWLPQSGEEPADQPCYENYLNNPRETAPEELLTEICLPLK